MRIAIFFRPRTPLILPLHYHAIVQGMIYQNLDQALAQWYHHIGYTYQKRRFKLFTFSRLWAKDRLFDRERKKLVLTGPIRLRIAAADTAFLESLATYLVRKRSLTLHEQVCDIERIDVELPPPFASPVRLRTLSPITVYRTEIKEDGKRWTHYIRPDEKDFQELLLMNLKRKAVALWGKADPLDGIWIRPIRVKKEVITYFKGTLIKAWDGEFEANLTEPYYKLMLDAGLGAKNAQGFGMIEVRHRREFS